MKILRPDDWHAHLRTGFMQELVVPAHNIFNRVLVMPNLTPPVTTADNAILYRRDIQDRDCHFRPIMTLKMHHSMTVEHLEDAVKKNIRHIKLYPTGVTTGSFGAIHDFNAIDYLLKAM